MSASRHGKETRKTRKPREERDARDRRKNNQEKRRGDAEETSKSRKQGTHTKETEQRGRKEQGRAWQSEGQVDHLHKLWTHLKTLTKHETSWKGRNHKTLGVKTLWSSSHSHKQVVWLVKASSSSAEPTASRPKKGGGKNQHKLGRAREKWPFYTSSQQALHTLERVGERRLWETKQVGREGTTRQ